MHSAAVPDILGNKFAGKLVIAFRLKIYLIFIILTTQYLIYNKKLHILCMSLAFMQWYGKINSNWMHYMDYLTWGNFTHTKPKRIIRDPRKLYVKAFKLNCFHFLIEWKCQTNLCSIKNPLVHASVLKKCFKYCIWIK